MIVLRIDRKTDTGSWTVTVDTKPAMDFCGSNLAVLLVQAAKVIEEMSESGLARERNHEL